MNSFQSTSKPIGFMPIPAGHGRMFEIEGGPFVAFERPTREAWDDPIQTFALCLEQRSHNVGQATVALDVPDFQTPKPAELDAALSGMVDALYAGRPAYVGCMAGQGRTGLVMACLAREFGMADPVKHVRRYYTPHAVETEGQKKFVKTVALPLTGRTIATHRDALARRVFVSSVVTPIKKKFDLRAFKKKLSWLFEWEKR